MAVPKKKTSRHRKGKRRSHHHLSMPPLASCSRCGAANKPHTICDQCGYYGGRQVLVDASAPSAAT